MSDDLRINELVNYIQANSSDTIYVSPAFYKLIVDYFSHNFTVIPTEFYNPDQPLLCGAPLVVNKWIPDEIGWFPMSRINPTFDMTRREVRLMDHLPKHHSVGKVVCEYCGRRVDSELDLCPSCGAPLPELEFQVIPSQLTGSSMEFHSGSSWP